MALPCATSSRPSWRLPVISDSVSNRIVVFSGKGGVGKTTVAVNLACMLSQRSYKVGLLDADIT
ncbi:P-loop NTPase, partial [Candidatus Bipolaricaulota bacterium]|nr:P-loop NTPase [Candidatus Bipolaricaulota bacterium]